jgi:lysine 6-dehydrogenase
MEKIIVLGGGMVGTAMAIDLAKDYAVTVADYHSPSLQKIKSKQENINTLNCDVTNKNELSKLIAEFDLVICAVPGFLGFSTLKTIIESKKNVVDISFFPENALDLHQFAIENNVTAIVDCGVAPGMGNIILGRYNELMQIDSFECLVGGLPKVKKWPFNYKAPFSPIDVIEEYTRPARYVENGNLVVKQALSDIEHIEFDKVGTLESFNSDGLRSLIFTMPHIKNMKEKTLRYPGHVEKILALRDAGFFAIEEIQVNGVSIRPIDFTSKILFKEWKLEANEEELTVMKISMSGIENGQAKKIIYELYDEFDVSTQTSSMARTTGYTATAAANLILKNIFAEKGIFPPELVGKHSSCFDFITEYLLERKVVYKKSETLL